MSWGATGFGKAKEAATQVRAALEQSKRFGNRHPELMDALARVAAEVAEIYPDRQVLLETSGHLDNYAGQFTLAVRVFPPVLESDLPSKAGAVPDPYGQPYDLGRGKNFPATAEAMEPAPLTEQEVG